MLPQKSIQPTKLPFADSFTGFFGIFTGIAAAHKKGERLMACHKSKEEQLRLGEMAVDLRDEERLRWRVIAERLGVNDITKTIFYYRKYKAALKAAKERMNLEQIEKFSSNYGIERGWIWLYENGFKRRVPEDVQEKIEEAKMRSC